MVSGTLTSCDGGIRCRDSPQHKLPTSWLLELNLSSRTSSASKVESDIEQHGVHLSWMRLIEAWRFVERSVDRMQGRVLPVPSDIPLLFDTLHTLQLELTEHRGMHLYYCTTRMRMFVWRTHVAVLPFRKGWSSSYHE